MEAGTWALDWLKRRLVWRQSCQGLLGEVNGDDMVLVAGVRGD